MPCMLYSLLQMALEVSLYLQSVHISYVTPSGEEEPDGPDDHSNNVNEMNQTSSPCSRTAIPFI